MPRRARPSYRLPPNKGEKVPQPEKSSHKPDHQSKTGYVESDDEAGNDEYLSGEDFEQDSEFEGIDGDAPRVSVWEADNDDFLAQQETEANKKSDENRLQNDLQNLPLGALRRAQQLLKQTVAESDSDSADDQPTETQGLKGKKRVEWSTKPLAGGGRRNKHAPVEMTAKKPVTRNRMVVDVPKIISRDPRFLPTAGAFDPKRFEQSYGFLGENRKAELEELRKNLKKARTMLASSPRELRSEREEEVERLERAMKRVESMVNRDRITRLEQEALSKAKKEEAERRKQGKGKWFLKKADEKELLVKARYDMLAKEGGQRAIQKAIDKRQKKESQKEKRARPYLSRKDSEAELERPPSKRTRV